MKITLKIKQLIAKAVQEEREQCAALVEKHKCGYDCFDEDLDSGEARGNGMCKYEIARDIRSRGK